MKEPARVQVPEADPVPVSTVQPRQREKPTSPATTARLAAVAGIGVVIWLLPHPADVDPRAWQLLAIFVATIAGIVVRPLPTPAVAILGLTAVLLTGTLSLDEALSGFASDTVWLIVIAYVLATGVIKTGLGARIAYGLVSLFGGSTLGLGYSIVGTDLVLAPAIPSHTARVGGVTFPILQSITRSAPGIMAGRAGDTNAFLTLTAYHGTVVTSAMFLTAMIGNPLAATFAQAQGISISWNMWAASAAVPGLLSLIVVPLVVMRLAPPGILRTPGAPAVAREALTALGPMTRDQRMMAAIAAGLLVGWIFGPYFGLDRTVAAIAAMAALLLTGVLAWNDISHEHDAWSTFVWFGTLVMMANFLGRLGLTSWFSGHVGELFAGIGWLTGFLGLCLTYFYTHYFFASNTAHVSAMYAPFLAVALGLGTPPLLAALVLGFLSSLFGSLTHYGNAAGPILFGSGHVSVGHWWKVGGIVAAVNLAIWFGIGGLWWKLLGLW
jgi:DASS family divalent anion:Na+ symporter